MLRRLKRRLAPWVAWEDYVRLTLGWEAAKRAHAGLTELALSLRVRTIERAELERFAGDPAHEISERFLESFRPEQDLCVGGFVAGELACYGFFSAAPTNIDEQLRFHFPERWIYVYKGFTQPKFRGQRFRAHVLLGGIPALEEWLGPVEAPIGLVTLVLSDNRASLKALARIGFRYQGHFPVLRLRARAYPLAVSRATPSDFFIQRAGSGASAFV